MNTLIILSESLGLIIKQIIIFRDLELHRSPAANGYGTGVNAKASVDNRQRLLSPSSLSSSSMCNTNGRDPALSNGVGSAAATTADTSAMQDHFTNSSKKVKEKLMLDEMHELLEEPVEEQVRQFSNSH